MRYNAKTLALGKKPKQALLACWVDNDKQLLLEIQCNNYPTKIKLCVLKEENRIKEGSHVAILSSDVCKDQKGERFEKT